MSDQAQEGVLLLLAAGVLLLLWLRGYLSSTILAVAGAVTTAPSKAPFAPPGALPAPRAHMKGI